MDGKAYICLKHISLKEDIKNRASAAPAEESSHQASAFLSVSLQTIQHLTSLWFMKNPNKQTSVHIGGLVFANPLF